MLKSNQLSTQLLSKKDSEIMVEQELKLKKIKELHDTSKSLRSPKAINFQQRMSYILPKETEPLKRMMRGSVVHPIN